MKFSNEIGWFVFLLIVFVCYGAVQSGGGVAWAVWLILGTLFGFAFITPLMLAEWASRTLASPWNVVVFVGLTVCLVAFFAVVPNLASGHPLPSSRDRWVMQIMPFFLPAAIAVARNVSRSIGARIISD
jgi:hypothetical protein